MSKTFEDNSGRSWQIAIHVNAVKQVRDVLDVDLLEAIEGKLLERLAHDPVLLCDVLYVLCREEAMSRGVSDVEFGRGLSGDAIEHAATALLEELVDFFPKGRRQLLATAIDKLRHLENRVLELAQQKLNDPALEAGILKRLAEMEASGN